MNSSKVSFWSGMAALATGICWMLWTIVPWSPIFMPALLLAIPAIYGLHARQAQHSPRWTWLASTVAMIGAATSALIFAFVIQGGVAQTPGLEIAFILGLLVMAGGLALLGLVTFRSTASSRMASLSLIMGALVAAYTGWFWLFILDRPYPPVVHIVVWLVLGGAIALGWAYLGQMMIRNAERQHSEA